MAEAVDIEESLIAQQQTLLWNEDKYLPIAPGERNVPTRTFVPCNLLRPISNF